MGKEIKKLSEFGKKVLEESEIVGNKLFLKTQMDRKQYVELNAILEILGGKWSRGKKCHIFDVENLKEAIEEVCESMYVTDIKVLYQQFYTPRELAKLVVELADIKKEDHVLEPSAGRGAIIEQLIDKYKFLEAVEIDPFNYNYLRNYYFMQRTDMCLNEIDFLHFNRDRKYHKIVMNPPFTKSQDVKHILKAYSLLKDGGRLVSLASASITTREGTVYDELRSLNPEFIDVEDGAFKESGTMVNTVIVIINK